MSEEQNPLAGWSEEDKAWLAENCPPEFRLLAQRLGRKLFALARHANASQNALGILTRRLRGNQELFPAVITLATALNEFINNWGQSAQVSTKDFVEARKEVDRVVQLAAGHTSAIVVPEGLGTRRDN